MKPLLHILVTLLLSLSCFTYTHAETPSNTIRTHGSDSIVLQRLFDYQDRINKLENTLNSSGSGQQYEKLKEEVEELKQKLSDLENSLQVNHNNLSNKVDLYEGRISDIDSGISRHTSALTGLALVITLAALFFGIKTTEIAITAAERKVEKESVNIHEKLNSELEALLQTSGERLEEKSNDLLGEYRHRLDELEKQFSAFMAESKQKLIEQMKRVEVEAGAVSEEEKRTVRARVENIYDKSVEEYTLRDWIRFRISGLYEE